MRPAFGLAFLAFATLLLGLLFWPGIACGCGDPNARAAVCMVSLKEQALGLAMYAADHDAYPARDAWTDGIRPYLRSEAALHAPELGKAAPGAYGYAFDARLSSAREPRHPERVILVFESTNLAKNASDSLTSLPRPGRHGGKNNLAFADGHAARVAP